MKLLVVFALVAVAYGRDVPILKKISFPTGRVVGGVEAPVGAAPYIVSLRGGFMGSHFCGGSILNKNTIITAAHCLSGQASSIKAVAGAHDIGNNAGTQSLTASSYIKHSGYTGGVGPYDIGLIFLQGEFEFNDRVQPVALPGANVIHSGDVILYGWGSTSSSSFPTMPKKLQTVTKPIVEYSKCQEAIPNSPLHETNVCTGPLTGGVSACSGDSGGPLVQQSKRTGDVELIGIVSWGYIPCGQANAPSVYTRTSAHIEWIEKNTL